MSISVFSSGNEHNNDEVQIKLDELDRIKKYLNNLKGISQPLNQV